MENKKGPKCPNHGVYLVDCNKGVGICPISGAKFTYKEDEEQSKQEEKIVIDSNGNLAMKLEETKYIVEGNEDD